MGIQKDQMKQILQKLPLTVLPLVVPLPKIRPDAGKKRAGNHSSVKNESKDERDIKVRRAYQERLDGKNGGVQGLITRARNTSFAKEGQGTLESLKKAESQYQSTLGHYIDQYEDKLRNERFSNIAGRGGSNPQLSNEMKELEQGILALKLEKNRSAKEMIGIEYGSKRDADDFADLIKKGASLPNSALKKEQNVAPLADPNYHQMSQDEVELYHYLLAKEGENSAQEYLDYLQEDLNQRQGLELAKSIKEIQNPIGRGVLNGVWGVMAGVDRNLGGVQQVFSKKKLPTSTMQFSSEQVKADLEDAGPKIFGNSIGRLGYDVLEEIGYSAPSILLTKGASALGATNKLASGIGALSQALPASGNAYQSAQDAGYDQNQARMYSVLAGALEGYLQYPLEKVGKLTGINGNIAKKIEGIEHAVSRAAAEFGSSVAADGLGTVVQEKVDPVLRKIIFNEEYDPASAEELMYAVLVDALTGMATKGKEGSSDTKLMPQDMARKFAHYLPWQGYLPRINKGSG